MARNIPLFKGNFIIGMSEILRSQRVLKKQKIVWFFKSMEFFKNYF
jgi:hypothetical protein